MNPYESPGEVNESEGPKVKRWWQFTRAEWVVIAATAVILALLLIPPVQMASDNESRPEVDEREGTERTEEFKN